MTDSRDATDPSDRSNLRQPLWADPPHPVLNQLEGYPELRAVLTQAVNQVITNSSVNRERDADLVEDVERAAMDAALTTYQRLTASASQASNTADEARHAQAHTATATAEVKAERVADSAAALHHVEEASADQVALVAAKAAAEVAATAHPDDDAGIAAAAALVVEAVHEAAAVKVSAAADAAARATHAAADAAADAAEEAASSASVAEVDAITDANARQQNTLQTCYEVAAATAQAMLTHRTRSNSPNRTTIHSTTTTELPSKPCREE